MHRTPLPVPSSLVLLPAAAPLLLALGLVPLLIAPLLEVPTATSATTATAVPFPSRPRSVARILRLPVPVVGWSAMKVVPVVGCVVVLATVTPARLLQRSAPAGVAIIAPFIGRLASPNSLRCYYIGLASPSRVGCKIGLIVPLIDFSRLFYEDIPVSRSVLGALVVCPSVGPSCGRGGIIILKW